MGDYSRSVLSSGYLILHLPNQAAPLTLKQSSFLQDTVYLRCYREGTTMSSVKVGEGVEIAYSVHRANPPGITGSSTQDSTPFIVLINGLADSKETWATQVPAFVAAGYSVLTYDNRGIGASSRPAGPYTSELMASDLKALVTALNVPVPFHLVGVSMGGMIAQTYALEYPNDIRSVILACTYAAPGSFCSRMFSVWADIARKIDVATTMRDVTLWCFTQEFFAPERQADLEEAEAAMRDIDMSVDAYLSQLNVIQVFDTTKQLQKLSRSHVLVLAGEEDILIPVRLSQTLHELIPGSSWCKVKGGHGCMWEFPGSFNAAVLRFLKSAEN